MGDNPLLLNKGLSPRKMRFSRPALASPPVIIEFLDNPCYNTKHVKLFIVEK